MHKRHRIFIAINLPQDVKKFLAGYKKKWAELPARWVGQDNLHITLIFLGYITDVELGEVCVTTKEVANRHNSFKINLNKISYAPNNKVPPRMVWASSEKVKELSLLKNDLEESLLEKIHFVPENRAFIPHITLSRISTFQWRAIDPEERPEVDENIDLNFSVESIEVMESVLRKTGPEYTAIESFNLKI